MTKQQQMELELAGGNRCPRTARRERRLHRANWWFDQMRQVVDRAFDFEPAGQTEGGRRGNGGN